MNLATIISFSVLPKLNDILILDGNRHEAIPYKGGQLSIQAGLDFYSEPRERLPIDDYDSYEVATINAPIPESFKGLSYENSFNDFRVFPYVPKEILMEALAEEKWRYRV